LVSIFSTFQHPALSYEAEACPLRVKKLSSSWEGSKHSDPSYGEDQCGIRFDVPLSENAQSVVESERGPNSFATISRDGILAASDWHNGLAR
jgi:hypothetical protein